MVGRFFYLSNSITTVVKSFVEWDEKVFDWFRYEYIVISTVIVWLFDIGPNDINEWAVAIPPSPLLESSQNVRPHEAKVSSAKGHHNWRKLLDF